jgi:hypothetical protein
LLTYVLIGYRRKLGAVTNRAQDAILPYLPSTVQPGVSLAHLLRQSASRFDLHQLPLTNAGTPLAGLLPLLPVLHQLRPEGEDAALSRLGGMDRAAVGPQESALRVPGSAQAPKVGSPINELALKIHRRHPQEQRCSDDIVFCQIDEPLLLAAGDAACLAFEAHVEL